MFFQYLYPIDHFDKGRGSKWPLAWFYRPFWAENFFEMVFSLNILEKQGQFDGCFANICSQKAIMEEEAIQNNLKLERSAVSL